jgi:hypothetical protein
MFWIVALVSRRGPARRVLPQEQRNGAAPSAAPLLSSFSAELATQDPASFPFNIRRIAGPPQAAIVARNMVRSASHERTKPRQTRANSGCDTGSRRPTRIISTGREVRVSSKDAIPQLAPTRRGAAKRQARTAAVRTPAPTDRATISNERPPRLHWTDDGSASEREGRAQVARRTSVDIPHGCD